MDNPNQFFITRMMMALMLFHWHWCAANITEKAVFFRTSDSVNIKKYAKKRMPKANFTQYAWEKAQRVPKKEGTLGWLVPRLLEEDTTIMAIFVKAENNVPADILEFSILSLDSMNKDADVYNLKNQIALGKATRLRLVQYSYISKKHSLKDPNNEHTYFDKATYEAKKLNDPEEAAKMIPGVLVYRIGNPPQK
jgi:hypothetical protein